MRLTTHLWASMPHACFKLGNLPLCAGLALLPCVVLPSFPSLSLPRSCSYYYDSITGERKQLSPEGKRGGVGAHACTAGHAPASARLGAAELAPCPATPPLLFVACCPAEQRFKKIDVAKEVGGGGLPLEHAVPAVPWQQGHASMPCGSCQLARCQVLCLASCAMLGRPMRHAALSPCRC